MNREEVRKAAEVMLAFADGKEIQYSYKGSSNWMDWVNDYAPSFDFEGCSYRIKPEPKYCSFKNQEECWREMHKHPDFGWVIYDKRFYSICEVAPYKITILHFCDPLSIDFMTGLEEVTFTDGTPFGIEI